MDEENFLVVSFYLVQGNGEIKSADPFLDTMKGGLPGKFCNYWCILLKIKPLENFGKGSILAMFEGVRHVFAKLSILEGFWPGSPETDNAKIFVSKGFLEFFLDL
jgi:hypothetical protein